MSRHPEWSNSYFSSTNTYTVHLASGPVRLRFSTDREAQGSVEMDIKRLGAIVRELRQAGLLDHGDAHLSLLLGEEGHLQRGVYNLIDIGEEGVYGITTGSQKVALLFGESRQETTHFHGPEKRGRDPERERKKRLEALLAREHHD